MSTFTNNDLKEVKQLISDLAKNQQENFEKLNEKINGMRVDIAILKEGQKALGKRLDDSQLSVGKRLDNLDFIARTVIGAVVLALIAGLGRLLEPNLH